MEWVLQGTDAQNALVEQALARCDFPWERLSKDVIPVEWLDLSRCAVAEHVDHAHASDYRTDDYDLLEVRGRVLGLAWYSGKVSLDLSLMDDPELAGEVFLSEAAHMVDFDDYMTDEHRIAVWNAVHDESEHLEAGTIITDGFDLGHGHGWFDVGQYHHFVGEAFMGLFVKAFSDYRVTIYFPDHPVTGHGAALVRASLLGESPPDDMDLGSDKPGCLLGRAAARVMR